MQGGNIIKLDQYGKFSRANLTDSKLVPIILTGGVNYIWCCDEEDTLRAGTRAELSDFNILGGVNLNRAVRVDICPIS